MWRRVHIVRIDISEESVVSIFRVEVCEKSVNRCLNTFSLAYFSTLKMEATRSSETFFLVRFTRRHIPEDSVLHL
jgi:hypothetical protein